MASESGVRSLTTSAQDGVLTVVIEREFDTGSLQRDWAASILNKHPAPYVHVRVDMTKCDHVSSTFFAGLMQLHFAYNPSGRHPILLLRPAPSTVISLKMLCLHSLFVIEN